MRALLFFALVPACSTPRAAELGPLSGPRVQSVPVHVAAGPTHVEANWKERLEQPYVFLEQRGDYRVLGDVMDRLVAEARALDLRCDRAPFALFFDDPGKVPLGELRSRACLPVFSKPARLGGLQYELLPRAMVVYARVQGAPAVAHAYPALFSYLRELGWQAGGPVREVYLMNPSEVGPEGLVTEVQIPWTARPE